MWKPKVHPLERAEPLAGHSCCRKQHVVRVSDRKQDVRVRVAGKVTKHTAFKAPGVASRGFVGIPHVVAGKRSVAVIDAATDSCRFNQLRVPRHDNDVNRACPVCPQVACTHPLLPQDLGVHLGGRAPPGDRLGRALVGRPPDLPQWPLPINVFLQPLPIHHVGQVVRVYAQAKDLVRSL